jgi:hypothetical protein
MIVIQTNTFICQRCNKIVSISETADIWCDPTISPPEGWGYLEDESDFVCDKCLETEVKNETPLPRIRSGEDGSRYT